VADQANSYLYANIAAPVAEVHGMPLTLGASLGYEDGPLAVEGEKVDWSLGLALEASGFEWAVSYVGSDLDDPSGDEGAVFALTRSY
jgi:hypothetical protein